MHIHEMVQLLVLLGISVVVPLLAVRLRLPAAALLILAGLAVGPAALGLVHDTATVGFVSEFGFLVLMFIAGMEIDFNALRDAGLRSLLGPVLTITGFFILSILAAWAIGLGAIEVLVISATSVGMPLSVLQEQGLVRTPFGHHVLITASVGEFFSIIAIVGWEMSTRYGFGGELLLGIGKMLALFVGSGLAIRLSRAVVWWYPEAFRRMVEHQDVAEIGVRGGLVVMLAFVVLAGLLGVEPILGAFIAGALVAFVLREKHALEAKVAAIGNGFFIPIFLVVVGVRFNPSLLDGAGILYALQLIGLAGLVTLLPSFFSGTRTFGYLERLAAGTLLAAPLTLVVAIGVIGQKLGAVTERAAAAIVLVALVLSIAFPMLFKLLMGLRERELSPPPPPTDSRATFR